MPKTEKSQILSNLLPMSPTKGPPLPRGWGIKWPWGGEGESVPEKMAKNFKEELKKRGLV